MVGISSRSGKVRRLAHHGPRTLRPSRHCNCWPRAVARRAGGARDKAAKAQREEEEKLERASSSILDMLGDSKATAAARESLRTPEPEPVVDAAAAELEGKEAAASDAAEAAVGEDAEGAE